MGQRGRCLALNEARKPARSWVQPWLARRRPLVASGGVQPGQPGTDGTGGAHIAQQMQTFEGGAGIASCLLSCSLYCFCPQWLTLTFNSLTNPLGVLTTPGLSHSSQCPSLGPMPFGGAVCGGGGQVSLNCLNGKPPNRSGVAPGGDRWELGPDLRQSQGSWSCGRVRSSMGKWMGGMGRDQRHSAPGKRVRGQEDEKLREAASRVTAVPEEGGAGCLHPPGPEDSVPPQVRRGVEAGA